MLTVENGEGLPNADSYISLVDARNIATKYGYTLPAATVAAEVALRNAVDYITQQEGRFSGSRSNDTQALSWPRSGAYKFSVPIPNNMVPVDIQRAQVRAAQTAGGGEINPDSTSKQVSSESVDGVVSVSYFEQKGTSSTDSIKINAADEFLKPFYGSTSASTVSFQVIRG